MVMMRDAFFNLLIYVGRYSSTLQGFWLLQTMTMQKRCRKLADERCCSWTVFGVAAYNGLRSIYVHCCWLILREYSYGSSTDVCSWRITERRFWGSLLQLVINLFGLKSVYPGTSTATELWCRLTLLSEGNKAGKRRICCGSLRLLEWDDDSQRCRAPE